MNLVVTHNAGFFSCCSVKLHRIVEFINKHKKLPDTCDSSKQFQWYKRTNSHLINRDITYDYFKHYNTIEIKEEKYYPIDYNWNHQFINYSDIQYNNLNPLIKMYFSPSDDIKKIINNMEEKYNLKYENICVLFYRGNDKVTETKLSSYESYLSFTKLILEKKPNTQFLLQSDETEFLEFMTEKFPNNSFYFKDEIRHIRKNSNKTVDHLNFNNYEFSKKYLAITIIMSKCKYVICGSGNCSIWIMFFRKNNKNTCQFLNGSWYKNLEI